MRPAAHWSDPTLPARVTVMPRAWPRVLEQYGAPDTYRLAAEWVRDCATVADWGGAGGCLAGYLPPTVTYTVIDGTQQGPGQVLADLTKYHTVSDGIVLRHVLDNTHDWRPILQNALWAFQRRMVVVTFTPDAEVTHRIDHANGWPTWAFQPDTLRSAMAPFLVRDEVVQTTHPERVYFLERRR